MREGSDAMLALVVRSGVRGRGMAGGRLGEGGTFDERREDVSDFGWSGTAAISWFSLALEGVI
jgi:hypothetical protein